MPVPTGSTLKSWLLVDPIVFKRKKSFIGITELILSRKKAYGLPNTFFPKEPASKDSKTIHRLVESTV